MNASRPSEWLALLFLPLVSCTVGHESTPAADAGRAPDAAQLDAAPVSFQCDPLETGIFVTGNVFQADGSLARRVLGSYDPGTNAFTELADVGSCIAGWYVNAMTVRRDGTAYFLLANQTIATYGIESGACDVHPLTRSTDDGLYNLISFVGGGSGSTSLADERLDVGFVGYGDGDPELLLHLDPSTFAESPQTQVATGTARLISLVGTEDGRLFAAEGNVVASTDEHDIVQIDPASGATTFIATTPARHQVWLRTAIALWDHRVFVFDAAGDVPTTTISEADLRAGTWNDPLLTIDRFELQAAATTTCVGVYLY